MAEQIRSLDQLAAAAAAAQVATPGEPAAAPREPVRDALNRAYATGKRKDAVARVWVKHRFGQGHRQRQSINAYLRARPVLQMILRQPFQIAGVTGQFDVHATVAGGGLSGQAGAVKHGISKALQLWGSHAARRAEGGRFPDARQPRG